MPARAGADAASEETIDQWRDEIDGIDAQLVTLLNRRAECALAIGRIKHGLRQPIHVPERERAVLDRVGRLNPGPLPTPALQTVFEGVIALMRTLEEHSRAKT